MKVLVTNILFAVTLGCTGLLAQTAGETSAEERIALMRLQEPVTQEDPVTVEKRLAGQWDLSVGTGAYYMPGYGSGYMFYAAPSYSLPLNDRWALHGGIIASRYQSVRPGVGTEVFLPNSISSLALYGAASYRMNERLILHGAGVKQLVSSPVTLMTGYPVDNLSLGATFRVSRNLSIGASVHMRNGSSYGISPFYGPGTPSPYYW